MYVDWQDIDIAKDKKLIEFPLILMIDNILCVHNVLVFETENDELYYVFDYKAGKSIMNFGVRHYQILQEKLPVDNISIFQMYDGNMDIVPVSESYRTI